MRALLATAAPVASLDEVSDAFNGLGAAQAEVTTSSGALSAAAASLPRAAYDAIVSLAPAPGHHGLPLLSALAAALKPGGKLIVKEKGGSAEKLTKALLLSGLASSSSGGGGSADGVTVVEASKPAWETGAKAAISFRSKPAAAAKAWTLDSGDDELVDDEELLTEEDKQRPAAPDASDDCEVGASGRKACKNCTCGRTNGDAPQVKLTAEMLENPQPSGGCGNCALGDAFRCAGCPYKGLPAFEYGKPVKVAADFLAADI